MTELFALLHELRESLEDLSQEDESTTQRSSRKTAVRGRKRQDGG
jgi:hypothetical protein